MARLSKNDIQFPRMCEMECCTFCLFGGLEPLIIFKHLMCWYYWSNLWSKRNV